MQFDATKPMDELENYLEHYGIKGMRWGVRRANPSGGSSGGSSTSSKKKPAVTVKRLTAPKASSTPPKKNLSELSDADLKSMIDRANLERQYKQLYNPPQKPGAKQEIVAALKRSAMGAGEQVLKAALVDVLSKGVTKASSGSIDLTTKKKKKD